MFKQVQLHIELYINTFSKAIKLGQGLAIFLFIVVETYYILTYGLFHIGGIGDLFKILYLDKMNERKRKDTLSFISENYNWSTYI